MWVIFFRHRMKAFHSRQVLIIVFRGYDFVQNFVIFPLYVINMERWSSSLVPFWAQQDCVLDSHSNGMLCQMKTWVKKEPHPTEKQGCLCNPRKSLYSSPSFVHLHKSKILPSRLVGWNLSHQLKSAIFSQMISQWKQKLFCCVYLLKCLAPEFKELF